MRNYDHPFPIFHQWKNGGHHLACRFIQENVLGVLELGREGGEAEIGSETRVGGGAGELHKEAPHESLFFP